MKKAHSLEPKASNRRETTKTRLRANAALAHIGALPPSPTPEELGRRDVAFDMDEDLYLAAEKHIAERQKTDPAYDLSTWVEELIRKDWERRAVVLDAQFISVANDYGFMPVRLAQLVLAEFASNPTDKIAITLQGSSKTNLLVTFDRVIAEALTESAGSGDIASVSDYVNTLVLKTLGERVKEQRHAAKLEGAGKRWRRFKKASGLAKAKEVTL